MSRLKKSIKDTILSLYASIVARSFLYRINRIAYTMSLRGLGILNSQSFRVSGEQHFLKLFFKKKDESPIVFDVGANKGDYSQLVRRQSKSARIFAFEPHPKTFLRLKKNIESLNVQSFNVGLGQKSERLKIYDLKDNDGSTHASVHKEAIENFLEAESVEHEVDITTLDEFCMTNFIDKIDLLKIDVEGNELAVLSGSEQLLKSGSIKCIQLEFNELNVISRVFLRDFMDLLDDFKFYRLLPKGKISLDDYDPVHCEIFAFQNIVAVKKNNE